MSRQYPRIYRLKNLVQGLGEVSTEINGRWLPARPLGLASLRDRFRCAWLVFRGHADAVVWPQDDPKVFGSSIKEAGTVY